MMDVFSYHMPTRIVYGQDAIDHLDEHIRGRKALLVTSEGFVKRGLVDTILSVTDRIVHVKSDVKSHPEFKDLTAACEELGAIDFDLIIALGGGSVLDAAKFFAVQNPQGDCRFVEEMIRGERPKEGYSLIPVISIPTTAGTGSEITPWATIWDMDEKKKYSLHLPELFSETALYDPKLTLSVPREITVQTGLDTLSHALESIWNKNANPITVGYATKAAKLIMENLVALSKDLENLQLRDNIMKACMYAGLAFSNTQTAIAHGMSYYITAHKNVPHGIACSFTLPMLIDNVIGKYDFVDEALTEIFGECSSRPLRELMHDLDVSTDFEDYGMDANELTALKESLTNNPRAGNSLVTP